MCERLSWDSGRKTGKSCGMNNNYCMSKSFKSFIGQELFVEFAQDSFNAGTPPQQPGAPKKSSTAKKQEIIDAWHKIQPNVPIYITPMEDTFNAPGDHSTYGEDGVRITGSWPFIASILGRIKDILSLENEQTNLRLVFRGIKADGQSSAERQAYAFYINLERRKPKKPKPLKFDTDT
jgi:hypothetical protein